MFVWGLIQLIQFKENEMRPTLQILITVITINTSFVSLALGSTDKKIVSGTICQPQDPEDRANLRYFARGVQAINKDVTVVCPIVRDSTQNRINWVDVRYQRGFDITPQGKLPEFTGKFKGNLFSCGNLDAGSSSCKMEDGASDSSNDPTSVHIETKNLPHSDTRYYVFKSELPKGTVLKSITYQEEE